MADPPDPEEGAVPGSTSRVPFQSAGPASCRTASGAAVAARATFMTTDGTDSQNPSVRLSTQASSGIVHMRLPAQPLVHTSSYEGTPTQRSGHGQRTVKYCPSQFAQLCPLSLPHTGSFTLTAVGSFSLWTLLSFVPQPTRTTAYIVLHFRYGCIYAHPVPKTSVNPRYPLP